MFGSSWHSYPSGGLGYHDRMIVSAARAWGTGRLLTPQADIRAQIRAIRAAPDQIEQANDHTENR
jgi:hypothetical protein